MSQSPPEITGVAEIVLNVQSIPIMREFYSRVLGFPVFSESRHESSVHAEPGEPTICFLTIKRLDPPFGELHPQLLALIDVRRHFAARQRFVGHDVSRSTLNHLAFQIPDTTYDQHLANLRQHGLKTTETEFPGMNAKAIFFKDPEENTIELICRAN